MASSQDTNQDRPRRFLVMLLMISALLVGALLSQRLMVAADAFQLGWKLLLCILVAVLVVYMASVYTTNGRGILGVAVFALVALVLLTVVLMIIASQTSTPQGLEVLKTTGIWCVFGLETLYLLFVTFN